MRRATLSDTATLLKMPRGILVLCALIYIAAAFHSVILAPLGWPATEVLWAGLFIPTVVLSFYFRWRGAAIALTLALVLFVGSEWLSHPSAEFHGERLVLLASIFLAILTLGLATGGLGELLRDEHERRVAAERLASAVELARAFEHEVNNPLAALLMETELLNADAEGLSPEHGEAIARITEQARRIAEIVARAAELEEPKSVEYVNGRRMTDLSSG